MATSPRSAQRRKTTPNRRNADLIDSWQSELGVDDADDDPYVDWLSDDPNELNDDELGIFSATADEVEGSGIDATGCRQ